MGWSQGDVIMEAQPYALMICQSFKEVRCNYCLMSSEVKKCASCKCVWYCGMACQKKDWKIHKSECPILKRVPHLPADSIRLYLRLVLRHLTGAATERDEKSESPCIRSFNDLMSHAEDIREDKKRYELFQIASDFLRAYTHSILQLPAEEILLDIFGKMVINTFTVVDEMLQVVAVAIYCSPSVLDHDCRPNAVASFDGRKVTVRAVSDVPSGSLSKVRLCYVETISTTQERQQQLQQQYYFRCDCDLCENTEWGANITSTEGSNEGDLDCVKACLARLEEMKKEKVSAEEALAVCEECLELVNLPDLNVYLTRLREKSFDLAVDAQEWDKALEFSMKNLRSYTELNPPYSPCVAFLHAHIGKLLLLKDRLKEAALHLKTACKNLSVSVGKGHALYRQVQEMLEQTEAELVFIESGVS